MPRKKKSKPDPFVETMAKARVPKMKADAVRIGKCAPNPTSTRALERRAYLIQRGLKGAALNGQLELVDPKTRRLLRRLSKVKDEQGSFGRWLKKLPEEEGKALAAAVEAGNTETDPDGVANMSHAAKQVSGVKWYWHPWVPYGFVSLVAGAPGVGKTSFVEYGLIRPAVLDCSFPNGFRGPSPGKVLFIDCEARQAINVQRMKQWGIPLNRVITPFPDPLATVSLDDAEALDVIREVVRAHKPWLTVVDSLRASHHQDENNSRVGMVLDRLARIARDTMVAMVAIHHTRKAEAGVGLTQDDVRGSNSQAAAAVSIIGIDQPDPNSEWRRVSVLKSNVASPPEPLGFLPSEGKPQFGPPPERPRKMTEIERARQFLRRVLADGKRPSQEVDELATEQENLSIPTLKRAKSDLGIVARKEGKVWFASLPDGEEDQQGTAPDP